MIIVAGALFAIALMFYKGDTNKVPGPVLAYYLWCAMTRIFRYDAGFWV